MYVINGRINGTNVKVVNAALYRGILLNNKALHSPRPPGIKVEPLECIYNMYASPRIAKLSVPLIIPESLLHVIPVGAMCELTEIVVKRYINVEYSGDFGHVYRSQQFRSDPISAVDEYVSNLKSVHVGDIEPLYELRVHSIYKLPYQANRQDTFIGINGHQSYGMSEQLNLPHDLLRICKIAAFEEGYIVSNETFGLISKHIDTDYFQWTRYELK